MTTKGNHEGTKIHEEHEGNDTFFFVTFERVVTFVVMFLKDH